MINEALLKTIGRLGLILLVLLALFIASSLPLELVGLGTVRPQFMLIAIYYLSITRPSLVPALSVFVIGIILDFISLYPLGLSAFIFVTVQWLVSGQRKFLLAQSFKVMWAGFGLVVLVSSLLQWMVFILFNFEIIPVKPILISAVLSVLIFPVLVVPLAIVNKALADSDNEIS